LNKVIERVYYTWDEWECYPAGFFDEHPPKGMTFDDCQNKYAEFLRNLSLFRKAGYKVLNKWKNSCEHNLTNGSMNRIAWMGQASMCIEYGISSKFRGGYHLLTDAEKLAADSTSLKIINYWMFLHGGELYTLETIKSKTEANLY